MSQNNPCPLKHSSIHQSSLNGLQPSMLGRNHQWPSSSCSGIGWGREKSAGKTASAGPCHNSTAQVNQGAPWQVPSDNFKDLRGLVEVEILPNRWNQIMVFVSLAHLVQKNYPAHQGSFICRTKLCRGLADSSCSQLASLDVGRALDIVKQTAKQPQWTSTSQHPLCLLTPWWNQKKLSWPARTGPIIGIKQEKNVTWTCLGLGHRRCSHWIMA